MRNDPTDSKAGPRMKKSSKHWKPSSSMKEELDRRLKAHQQNPSEGTPWSIVRERIKRLFADTQTDHAT